MVSLIPLKKIENQAKISLIIRNYLKNLSPAQILYSPGISPPIRELLILHPFIKQRFKILLLYSQNLIINKPHHSLSAWWRC